MALDWYRYSLPIQTIDELLEETYCTSKEAFTFITTIDESESRLMYAWSLACQEVGMETYGFYDYSLILYDQLPQAIAILKATYTNMTKKELTNHPVRQRNPYQKMLYILEEAYTNQQHLGAFCD